MEDEGPILPGEWEAFRIWIAHDADRIATRTGADPERIVTALLRLVQEIGGDPVAPDFVRFVVDRLGLQYLGPTLEQAILDLGPDRAFHLFESEDLWQLKLREDLVMYLADPQLLFGRLPRLVKWLRFIVQDLASNRDAILATGLPTVLIWPEFPTRIFTPLYPARNPVLMNHAWTIDGVHIETDWEALGAAEATGERPLRIRSYAWGGSDDASRSDAAFQQALNGYRQPYGLPPAYQRASLWWGLDATDASRIESIRPKLLDLKIALLRAVIDALLAQNARRLWSVCLSLMTDALLGEEAEFCLRTDRFFGEVNLLDDESPRQMHQEPGGLTTLLMFIGTAEHELTTAKTFNTVSDLESLLVGELTGSYFELAAHPRHAEMDAILDRLIALDDDEFQFWRDYRARVNEALENEFRADILLHIPMKRKLADRFEPHLRLLAELQRHYTETTGTLMPLSMREQAGEPLASSDGGALPRMRPSDLQRYSAAWRIMTPLRKMHWTNTRIAEHLKNTVPKLRVGDRETVAKVIRYGDAGLLDF